MFGGGGGRVSAQASTSGAVGLYVYLGEDDGSTHYPEIMLFLLGGPQGLGCLLGFPKTRPSNEYLQ